MLSLYIFEVKFAHVTDMLEKMLKPTCPFPPQVLGSHPQTGFEHFERDFYLQIALLRFSISHFDIWYEKNN